jgi:hypothetical protein
MLKYPEENGMMNVKETTKKKTAAGGQENRNVGSDED